MKELSTFGHVIDSSPSQSTWSSKSVARMHMVFNVKLETRSSEGERYPYGGLEVKSELRPKLHGGAIVPGKVEDHEDGTYTITFTSQTAGPHQLLITMDGEHVEDSPHDLHVRPSYSTLCNPQQVIGCSGGPVCIAIHESGDIYVACYSDNIIRVFDQGGHEKRTIGSGGSGDGQFSGPHGIFIEGDVIYVADWGNHCIQKLTTGGQFLKKLGQFGSGVGQFNLPLSVIVDQGDRMIVADSNNHRVVILDQIGSCLLTINGNVSGSHGFRHPWGLALDPQGNIHVADRGFNIIKVFTPDGTYARSYGDLRCPSGIAIDEDGYIFVCEFSSNCLSIYNPQGNKIHTVGNLSDPRGVALGTASDSLYLANYDAKTSHVLKYSV